MNIRVDIFLNYKKFAVVFEGLLIIEQAEFKNLYVSGRMKIDVLACLPFDTICWIAGVRNIRYVSLMRLSRFLHLIRFPTNINSTIC